MRKFLSSLSYAGLLLLTCIVSNKTYADGKTKDNYFTVGSLSVTPVYVSNDIAFSLLVEAGSKSDRVNGTLGFFADECNRFKISAEYLSQQLHYKFETGRVHRWMHQYAFGGKFQHIFECPSCFRGLELGFFYSNAPNKSLSHKDFNTCSQEGAGNDNAIGAPHFGVPCESGTLFRKIAGAWSWEVDAGFLMCPWKCASLIPSITYQQVTYSRHHESKKRLSGVGFSLAYNQRLFKNLSFDIRYQFMQAYNDLRGSINWNKIFPCGALGFGVFVDHVYGKRQLASSTTTGIQLSFAFGVCGCALEKVSLQSNCGPDCCCDPCYCGYDLLDWVRDPAVYMPEVLAIVDEHECFPPSDSLPIDGFELETPPFQQQINLNDYFNVEDNDEISYDVTIDQTSGDAEATFDPESGIISLDLTDGFSEFEVHVVATNDCGVDPVSFEIDIND